MSHEYRLHLCPPLRELDAACDTLCARSEWRRIPTSLIDRPDAVGVRRGDVPANPSWPHAADLYLENVRVVFVVAHDHDGSEFLRAWVAHLESLGHSVQVDDDV